MKVKSLYVQDLVKSREVEVSRVATETNLADMGYETLTEPQTGILHEFDGEEPRERDDVPIRHCRNNSMDLTRTQRTISTDDADRERQESTL